MAGGQSDDRPNHLFQEELTYNDDIRIATVFYLKFTSITPSRIIFLEITKQEQKSLANRNREFGKTCYPFHIRRGNMISQSAFVLFSAYSQ